MSALKKEFGNLTYKLVKYGADVIGIEIICDLHKTVDFMPEIKQDPQDAREGTQVGLLVSYINAHSSSLDPKIGLPLILFSFHMILILDFLYENIYI